MVRILKAEPSHYQPITDIYNEAILHTTATFDTRLKSKTEMAEWILSHNDKYPVFISILNTNVTGWASLSQWSDRCAYSNTAENSVYVAQKYKGQGIGKLLLKHIIVQARMNGIHTIIARIAQGNPVSVKLHESCGFRLIGNMKEVGWKFDTLLDVGLYQIIL